VQIGLSGDYFRLPRHPPRTDLYGAFTGRNPLLSQIPVRTDTPRLAFTRNGTVLHIRTKSLPRMHCGRPLTSPHPVAAHRSRPSNVTSSSKPNRYSRCLPRPKRRGLRHSLVIRERTKLLAGKTLQHPHAVRRFSDCVRKALAVGRQRVAHCGTYVQLRPQATI
jgi:hypothetical protein